MTKYITKNGDTFDSIAYQLFGDEGMMKQIISENIRYADVMVFDSGTELSIPDMEGTYDSDLPFWHSETSDMYIEEE